MGNSWTDRPGTACPCQRAARRTRRKRCGSTGARRKGSGTSASSSSAARRARAGLTVVTTARPSSPSTLRHLAWQERLALVGAAQVRWGVVPTQPIGSGPRGGGGGPCGAVRWRASPRTGGCCNAGRSGRTTSREHKRVRGENFGQGSMWTGGGLSRRKRRGGSQSRQS